MQIVTFSFAFRSDSSRKRRRSSSAVSGVVGAGFEGVSTEILIEFKLLLINNESISNETSIKHTRSDFRFEGEA